MASSPARPIPEGWHSLTPHLICAGASEAIAFYAQAFGAVEISRLAGPDGKLMNAQIRIGDSNLMLVDEMPQWGALGPTARGGTPVTLHLYVEQVDAAYAQAVAAGATPVMPPQDMFWGDRYGQVRDPFGHLWSLATHQRDLTPEQIRAGMAQAMSAQRDGKPG